MKTKFNPLFTPWKIGNCEIKNRIVLCPMGGTSLFGWMEKHKFDKDAASFFREVAENDVGLIIPGIAPIRNMMGGQWLYKAKGAFRDIKKFMEEIHKTGAKLFVQLTAGFGRSFSIPNSLVPIIKNKFLKGILKPIIDLDRLCASPSKMPSRWLEGYECREISKKEIEEMVLAFAKTAKMLQEAGVDGVEIHAVHEGYLLDQFTLSYTNKRQDEYGGSFENRYRFATDIVKAIKKECGDFPVSLRYSVVSKTKDFCVGAVPGEKFKEIGRDMKESEKAAKYLEEAGYDMLNCDNGTYDAWYWAHPPAYMPQNCNLEEVAHIKQFVNIPVVCAGRMEPETASKAIKEKQIDAMGVARQFLADSAWITKLKEDRPEDILPCICCHNGCFPMSHHKGVACDAPMDDSKHMARCALNPTVMDGGKYDLKPAKQSKKIAIVGGGIGGMEVARVARLRGHRVTIFEKTKSLGGVFVAAAAPSFKEQDKKLLKWYKKQIKDLEIEVNFETEIKSQEELADFDEIVVATGATPKHLRLSGAERCLDATDYLNGAEVGEKVVIVGGGLTGCEIAYDLFLKGKKPVIVEALNDLMTVSGLCLANSSFLRDFFNANKIPVHLETKLTEIRPKSVVLSTEGQTFEVKADSIILAIGYKPNPIFRRSKHVHIVGDAEKVGNLRTVVWKAWEVAEKI